MSDISPAGSSSRRRQPRPSLSRAVTLMEEALRVLDRIGAPPEIGAQLDMAIQRARSALRDGLS